MNYFSVCHVCSLIICQVHDYVFFQERPERPIYQPGKRAQERREREMRAKEAAAKEESAIKGKGQEGKGQENQGQGDEGQEKN